MANRGEIYNRDKASTIRDFSGLKYGKITPTDIDAFLDFKNRLFILIEGKEDGVPVPKGQMIALKRIANACNSKTRSCILVIVNNKYNENGDVNYSESLVRSYYHESKWSEIEDSGTTLSAFIDYWLTQFGLDWVKS